jgi:serine/threonine-protein phosphatase PP1 catalytic subunit
MSVSGELLCSFELLKPLDSSALKSHIKKGRNKRQSMLNSPVSDIAYIDCGGEILTRPQPASQFPQSY